jgi:Tfp pilus tip-associated adhesin PilY1
MNNIARAGGTTEAYFAVQEDELFSAIVKAIYSAASGSYSSSPSTASASTQTSTGVDPGKLLLDSRVDFPSWKGNLIAYNLEVTPPVVAWNAASVAFNATTDPGFWKKRNVWTSETVAGVTTMVKVDVNASTGNLVNAAKLTSLGLGANDAETTRVVKWMLGDPAMGNPAVLGALVNSTPIDIGPPADSLLLGGSTFYTMMKARPYLTYVGSSDGMLHAFFTRDVTIGGTPYRAGQEAFAYIPQDLLQMINKLYVQGGQRPDPKDHLFGVASSPKATNLCSAGCSDASTATWKTVLVMTEGYGGRDTFMLDITAPHTTNGIRSGVTDPPVKVLWNTEYLASATDKGYFDTRMGQTISVPAFYLGKTASLDDYRTISTSGYSDGVSTSQGKYLVSTSAMTGASIDWDIPTPPVTCANPGLDYAMLTDVATAKNQAMTEKGQISAAYFGDTWGNLWRYVPALSAACSNCTSTIGTVSLVNANGCGNPLHFAPTVVQLDQNDPSNRPGEIYLVQATNSSLDAVTGVVNASYPASRLVFRKELAAAGVVSAGTFADGSSALVKSSAVSAEVCAVTNATGTTCTTAMPAGARPTATPMAILRADGTGFQVLTVWYVPVLSGCDVGTSYLTIHELLVTGGVTQKYGRALSSEPITGMTFVNGKLVFATSTGVVDVSALMPTGAPKYVTGSGGGAPTVGGRFKRTAWSEMP